MSAFVVNNCPWTVHFQIQVDASKKASFTQGVGKRELGLSATESAKAFTDTMPDGYDFPSCWNSGGSERPANCARAMKIEFNMNTYTCGSLGMQTTWKHETGGGGTTQSNGAIVLSTAMNYGRDCTGSPTERAPGSLGGTTGGCPAIPPASAVKPAVLTVQCGTAQNVLKWQNPKTLNAAVNSVLRTATSPTGAKATTTIFGEGGCWNSFGISTFTDTVLQAGYSYTYAIKTHPNIKSNEVTCKGGVQVTLSPTPQTSGTPTGSVTPTATPIFSATPTSTPIPSSTGQNPTPTPIVTITATPVFTPSDSDIDGDGIPNTDECPGYVPGTSTSSCPDSDGDGIPDILDPAVLGSAGGVQTGPGEATLLAMIISALVSLVYVSYAHSPIGKRREAEAISKDQGPLDFRS
jgi:hypothetical protein